MPRGIPPPTQRNRPIGFRNNFGGAPVDMIIRPEELTRFEPSRLAVQQTLGGAWIDSFGRGIITIKISGHTGWRAAPFGGGGEAAFQTLRTGSFTAWHAERARIVAGGGDPSGVALTFVDTLDGNSDLVAPKSFTLRRSKSRPLLMQFSIEMLVLQDLGSPTGIGGAPTGFGFLTAAAGLAGIANNIGQVANTIGGAVNGAVGAINNVGGALGLGTVIPPGGALGIFNQGLGAINNGVGIVNNGVAQAQNLVGQAQGVAAAAQGAAAAAQGVFGNIVTAGNTIGGLFP